MSIRYKVAWPPRAGMTKPSMSAADPPGLQVILAKCGLRQPAFVYEGAAVRQENASITVEYFRPGSTPLLSANVLSAPM
jgi:hypothetical protein